MEKKLISQIEFARLSGCSAPAINKILKNRLQACMVGKRVDVNHALAIDYLAKRNLKKLRKEALESANKKAEEYTPPPTVGVAVVKKRKKAESQEKLIARIEREREIPVEENDAIESEDEVEPYKKPEVSQSRNNKVTEEVPEEIEAYADMTLRELISRFGTETAMIDWLKATKEIEIIHEKRLKNAQTEGKLVSRDLIKLGVIDHYEAAHIKLLTDGAKTIARRATALHAADTDIGEIERFVKDQITSFLRPVKTKVERTLKNA